MNKIQQALKHVKDHHPEVTQVFYSRNGSWFYCDDDFNGCEFDDSIDLELLDDALNEVETLPCGFGYVSC